MSDEHQRRALGAAMHPVVETPHLDALADQGVRFTRAWTPSPICVPARASFATGQWVHRLGNWDSAQPYAGRPKGWAHAVRSTGARVAAIGKLHHRSHADDQGFNEQQLAMHVADGVGWVQGLPRRQPLPFPEAAEFAADVGEGESDYTRYDRRITSAAIEWLGEHGAGSEPWVLFVSFVAPHYPLTAPIEFFDRYRTIDIPSPEVPRQALSNPAVAAVARFFNYHDYFDQERVLEARRAYYALTTFLDSNVGEVIAALDASGERENTHIIYTSDHGEMLGNRGLWAKSFLYEDSVGIPLIMSGPMVAGGQVFEGAVNLVDVSATIADIFDVSIDGSGESLLDVIENPERNRVGFSEYHDGGSITGSFAVTDYPWKLIHHVGYQDELYNLSEDPNELNDLANDREHRGIVDACTDRLRSIVDPAVANEAAFQSQEKLIAEFGGIDALARFRAFNHTPTPV